MNCPTPHIGAKSGEFAKTVIMPGDPLRARFIAENFLKNAKLINDVRGMYAFTGDYKGTRISVMASGMGMPSMGIYCYELFNAYGVENIIRTGTTGAISNTLALKDIIIADKAYTNSAFSHQYKTPVSNKCSKKILTAASRAADLLEKKVTIAPIFTSDIFYFDDDSDYKIYAAKGALAVDMETAALYYTANRYQKNALSVCTVSDSIITGETTSSKERETAFVDMIILALDTANRLS